MIPGGSDFKHSTAPENMMLDLSAAGATSLKFFCKYLVASLPRKILRLLNFNQFASPAVGIFSYSFIFMVKSEFVATERSAWTGREEMS